MRGETFVRVFRRQEAVLFVGLLGLVALYAVVAPYFLTIGNAYNIVQESSFVGIVALGMTPVILAAEIDLSVGSMAALSSASLGVLFGQWGWPLGIAMIACLLIGLTIGSGSGFLVSSLACPLVHRDPRPLHLAPRRCSAHHQRVSDRPVSSPSWTH